MNQPTREDTSPAAEAAAIPSPTTCRPKHLIWVLLVSAIGLDSVSRKYGSAEEHGRHAQSESVQKGAAPAACVPCGGLTGTAQEQPAPPPDQPETLRYVRRAGEQFVMECRFAIARRDGGWTITSTTERGATRMVIEASYDAADRLRAAKAVLTTGETSRTATVQVRDGKATVRAKGREPATFDVPKGTMVTSAPDWTDILLLCRRYDRQRQGKQDFPALWIHPTQPAQRLTFSIEHQGTDAIQHDGKKVELVRYLVRIRNNSTYAAWADAEGRLIRLLPLPLKDAGGGMTLAGWEKAAAGLRPVP